MISRPFLFFFSVIAERENLRKRKECQRKQRLSIVAVLSRIIKLVREEKMTDRGRAISFRQGMMTTDLFKAIQ